MKNKIIIDLSKCIGCSACVNDCIASTLKLVDGKAKFIDSGCINCGHCECVCPTNAIKVEGIDNNQIEINEQTRLDSDELLLAIKTRRSIRQFINKPVEEEKIKKIIEAGRMTPTARNSQKTKFYILGSKQKEIESHLIKILRRLAAIAKPFSKQLRTLNFKDEFFFNGAPLVIAISGLKVDASLAASNMALMAESLGLGTMFSGMFTIFANLSGKTKKVMKLKGKKIVTTLVIGYPNVKYYRTPKRNKAEIVKL